MACRFPAAVAAERINKLPTAQTIPRPIMVRIYGLPKLPLRLATLPALGAILFPALRTPYNLLLIWPKSQAAGNTKEALLVHT